MLSMFLAACSSPELATSLDPAGYPLLGELPAEATVVTGARSAPFLTSPLLFELEAGGWLDLEAVFGGLWEDSGLYDAADAEVVVGACAARGCAALVSGRTDDLSIAQLADSTRLPAHADGVAGARADGTSVAFQIDRDRPVVRLGHARAVEALAELGPRLDPRALVDRIPEGDAWVYAERQDDLAAQVDAFLGDLGTEDAEVRRAAFAADFARRPWVTEEITSVALSVAADASVARLRLVCAGDLGARAVAAALRVARAGATPEDPRAAAALAEVEIVRVGSVVEATFAPDAAWIAEVTR